MGMFVAQLALFFSVLLGGTAWADECRLALAAALPLTILPGNARLLIDVIADRTPLTMIIDTGAEGIVVTDKAAARMTHRFDTRGIDEAPLTYANGVGGSRVATRMTIDNLVLGHMHGTYDNVLITDGDFSTKARQMDGLIGMTVLANFDFDLDLPGKQLRLFRANRHCARPEVVMTPPFYLVPLQSGYHDAVRLMLPVVINGVPLRALLDTGSPRTLLFSHAAAAAGLGPASAAGLHKVVGLGGATNAFAARLSTLAVGPLLMRNVPVVVAREDNSETDLLLGLDFVTRMHVWVSNSTHMLVLQYPPQPSPMLAGDE